MGEPEDCYVSGVSLEDQTPSSERQDPPPECASINGQIDEICMGLTNYLGDHGITVNFLDQSGNILQALIVIAQAVQAYTAEWFTSPESFRDVFGPTIIDVMTSDPNNYDAINRGWNEERGAYIIGITFDYLFNGTDIGDARNLHRVNGVELVMHELAHNLTWQGYSYFDDEDDNAWLAAQRDSFFFGSRSGSYCYRVPGAGRGCEFYADELTADLIVSLVRNDYGYPQETFDPQRIEEVRDASQNFLQQVIQCSQGSDAACSQVKP